MYTPFPEEISKWILYNCPQNGICLVTVCLILGYIKSCQKMAKKLLAFVFSTSQILFVVTKTLISLTQLLRSFV